MRLNNFIEGLRVLQPYYNDPNGHHIDGDRGTALEQFFNFGSPSAFRAVKDMFNTSRDDIPKGLAGIVGLAKAAKTDPVAKEKLQQLAYADLTGAQKEDAITVVGQQFAQHMARQERIDLGPAPQRNYDVPGMQRVTIGGEQAYIPQQPPPGPSPDFGDQPQAADSGWGPMAPSGPMQPRQRGPWE